MSPSGSADKPTVRYTTLRAVFLAVGGLMVLVALLADRIGLDSSASFGKGEILLLSTGLVVAMISLAGSRFVGLYKASALIFLNTLLLLLLVEIAAVMISSILAVRESSDTASLPYYAAQEWGALYWRENRFAEQKEYHPFVGWRRLPFTGETINIDLEGRRRTPGASCGPGAAKVFAFGGSTMWGWGSPDWETIPAHLQQAFQEILARPVCVVNFGEDGFSSTQGLIELILQLREENTPDVVLFYDGVNEVGSALALGHARGHYFSDEIARRLERPYLELMKQSAALTLSRMLLQRGRRPRSTRTAGELSDLADSVVASYVANYEMVETLSARHEFESFFFWQPFISESNKELTSEEREILEDLEPEKAALFRLAYERVAAVAPGYERLFDIADVFDGERTGIWIDDAHVTPTGNRLVAERMMSRVGPLFRGRNEGGRVEE